VDFQASYHDVSILPAILVLAAIVIVLFGIRKLVRK
jgi:uncharacterized membrane protein